MVQQINNSNEKKSINFWPYALVSCLILMGIINFLVFTFAQTVNSPAISKSPYDDSLELNSVREEEQCSNDLNIDLSIKEENGNLIIKQIFKEDPLNNITSKAYIINKLSIFAWSTTGKDIKVENIKLIENDNIFIIKLDNLDLARGYWYFKIKGEIDNCTLSCCKWTIIKDKLRF